MARGTTMILPSMHGSTFVWQANRELRMNYERGKAPLIYVNSLLKRFLFLFRHLRQDIGNALRHLDVTPPTPAVATAESFKSDKSGRETVETGSVLLSDLQNRLSFLCVHLYFLRCELVYERFNGKVN